MTGDGDGRQQGETRTWLLALLALLAVSSIASASYLSIAGSVYGPGSISAPNGPTVTVDGSTTMNLSDPPDAGELPLRSTDGNVTFWSSGQANVMIHVDQFTGLWTNLTALDVATELTVDAEDMANFSVGAAADSISVAATRQADDDTVDFAYSASGSATVSFPDVAASTQFAAVSDSGTVLDTASSDSGGSVTFASLDPGTYDVRLQTNQGGPSLSIGDPDGATVRTSDPKLSIDVDDPDFPDDTVSVEFYVNGAKIDTVTAEDTGTATAQASGLSDGLHDWHAVATDSYGESNTSPTYSFTVDHWDPVVENMDPSGDISTKPTDLEVTVSDNDFAGDGDSLDVYFELDGQDAGSDTLTANGTATASISSIDGGSHTWTAQIQDQYGKWTNQTVSFSTPSELRIYNESDPNQLLKNVSVDLEFYFRSGDGGNIYTKTAENGTVDMTGLPVGQPFVVVADTSGYNPRRIFVRSLYDTQSVYLLPNENVTTAPTVFEIEDYSGDYPQKTTVLEVQRAINNSWQTVEGDYFGATGQFSTIIEFNVRHRMVLYNTETGEQQVLGTFTPLGNTQQTVTVTPGGDITVEGAGVVASVAPSTELLPKKDGITLTASTKVGSETKLANWSATAYYNTTGGTNMTLDQQASQSVDGGSLDLNADLAGRDDGKVIVVVEYTTEGGVSDAYRKVYAVSSVSESDYTLLGQLKAFVGLIAPANQGAFSGTFAIVLTVVLTGAIATRLRLPSSMVGLVATGLIAGFAIIGWVGYELLFVALVAWVSLTILGRRY